MAFPTCSHPTGISFGYTQGTLKHLCVSCSCQKACLTHAECVMALWLDSETKMTCLKISEISLVKILTPGFVALNTESDGVFALIVTYCW